MAVFALLVATALASSAIADRSDDFAVVSKHQAQGDALLEDEKSLISEMPECARDTSKPIFFDMVHSNNAGRVRLFIRLYAEEQVPICFVTYADMRSEWFKTINPNQKVPAIVIPTGQGGPKEVLYESNVIFEYMVDTVAMPAQPPQVFKHRDLSPIHRAKVNLMCRVHDMYVASPNCNQPGCTHSQGALYLPPPGEFDNTDGRRAVDIQTRSNKINELWTRWTWLEDFSGQLGAESYLAGDFLSMADMTWFPTAVFMEFLLTHVAQWPVLFAHTVNAETKDFTAPGKYGEWVAEEKWNPGNVDPNMKKRFPKLTSWYPKLLELDHFQKVREEILGFWVNERHLDKSDDNDPAAFTSGERVNRFAPIKRAIADAPEALVWKPVVVEGSLVWPGQ